MRETNAFIRTPQIMFLDDKHKQLGVLLDWEFSGIEYVCTLWRLDLLKSILIVVKWTICEANKTLHVWYHVTKGDNIRKAYQHYF